MRIRDHAGLLAPIKDTDPGLPEVPDAKKRLEGLK